MDHRRTKTRHCREKSCSRQEHIPCSSARVKKCLTTPLTLYSLKLSNNNYKSVHRVCLSVRACVYVCVCVCTQGGTKFAPKFSIPCQNVSKKCRYNTTYVLRRLVLEMSSSNGVTYFQAVYISQKQSALLDVLRTC